MVGGYACKRSEMTVLVAKRWQDMLLAADSRTDFLSFLFFGSYSLFGRWRISLRWRRVPESESSQSLLGTSQSPVGNVHNGAGRRVACPPSKVNT